jgi:hypothetical protein
MSGLPRPAVNYRELGPVHGFSRADIRGHIANAARVSWIANGAKAALLTRLLADPGWVLPGG